MAVSALESLASNSHQQAEKSLADAARRLKEPLDEKMKELGDFRSQIKTQTKNLNQLITSCNTRSSKLDRYRASQEQLAKARDMQMEIEVLNQHIRVVEKTEALREMHLSEQDGAHK